MQAFFVSTMPIFDINPRKTNVEIIFAFIWNTLSPIQSQPNKKLWSTTRSKNNKNGKKLRFNLKSAIISRADQKLRRKERKSFLRFKLIQMQKSLFCNNGIRSILMKFFILLFLLNTFFFIFALFNPFLVLFLSQNGSFLFLL